MRKFKPTLFLLMAAVLAGALFMVANRLQAAPPQQDTADGADTTVFLPFVSSQAFIATSAAPLLPEQYDSASATEPVIDPNLLQAATCWSNIKFSNSSSYSIQIYWVNSSGNEVLYKTLSSQSSYWQQTYWGYSWSVRTTSGTLLKSLTTYTCLTTYVHIYNSDFPQPTATPTKTPTPTPTTPAGACYTQIIATHSNKCMKVKDGSTQSGAEIVQYSCDSNSNQLFSFSLVAGTTDTYVVTAKQSGKVLDIYGGSTQSGKNVIQNGANGGNSQKWKVIPVSGDVYELKNVNSGLVADVNGASTSNGANIIQWADGNAANQRWKIASCIQPPAPTATPTNTPAPALGSIGDFVWNDLNRNGIQEGGEPGVSGVGVDLLSCGGNTLTSTTTNGSGNYSFGNLAAACYLVRVNLPGGFQFSPKAQGTNGNLDSDINIGNALSDAINLGAGQNLTNIDAGINQPVAPTATPTNTPAPQLGSIGDKVFRDANGNGIQDGGEAGIAGIEVQLRSCGGATLQTTTTNGNGNYTFSGLAAGCYVVRFVNVNATAYAFSPANQGGNDALDSDVTAQDSVTPGIVNGQTDNINLGAGQNLDTVDAGLIPQAANNGAIGDRVWKDTNGNGVQDGGEPSVPGVTVELLAGCSGTTVVASKVTNSNGSYLFTGLAAGQYRVKFTLIAGYTGFSPKNAIADDDYDSEANPDGVTDCFTLASGQEQYSIDAGLTSGSATPTNTPVSPTATPTNTPVPTLGSIGDKVWKDTNGNGVQDGGEPGVSGVTVQLKDCSGNELQTTTTNGNGNYTFSGLAAGCYTVTVSLPGGYTFSPQDLGGNDNTDSDVNPSTGTTASIVINAGQNRDNVDAGLVPQPTNTGSIGDKVWKDTNGNGVQDNSEPGVPGVTVRLQDCAGNVQTTTTNGNGNYSFTGLAAGCYTVTVVLPNGYTFSPQDQGGDDNLDSDVNPGSGATATVVLNAGQSRTDVDAGLIPQSTGGDICLGDRVWNDANANGLQDNGEVSLSGVEIYLGVDSNNDGRIDRYVGNTTTNSSGIYQFCGLTPNTPYLIEFVPPGNCGFTLPNIGNDDTIDSDANVSKGIAGPVTVDQIDNSYDAGLVCH